MTPDTTFYVVMAIAVTILGLSKGGFAGIGMVSTPMVAAVTDPITAAGLMLPIMLVQDPIAVYLYRRSFDKEILFRMIPGGLVGVVAAYLLASTVPEWGVKFVLGFVSLIFSVWQAYVHFRGVPEVVRPKSRYDAPLGLGAGAAGGFASAIAHAGSPPFQIYVMPKHLPKEIYVGTSVMFFAALNVMKLPSFAALGLFSVDSLAISALFIPIAVASSWAGAWLVRYINAKPFNLIITLILLLISVVLMVQAFEGARGDLLVPWLNQKAV